MVDCLYTTLNKPKFYSVLFMPKVYSWHTNFILLFTDGNKPKLYSVSRVLARAEDVRRAPLAHSHPHSAQQDDEHCRVQDITDITLESALKQASTVVDSSQIREL